MKLSEVPEGKLFYIGSDRDNIYYKESSPIEKHNVSVRPLAVKNYSTDTRDFYKTSRNVGTTSIVDGILDVTLVSMMLFKETK